MPEQTHALREHFLESFILQLISNSYIPEETPQETAEPKTTSPVPQFPQQQTLRPAPPQNLQTIPLTAQNPGIKNMVPPRRPQQKYQGIPRVNVIPLPQEQFKQRPPKPGEKPDTIKLGKLAQILIDPAVYSVECPGPDKNLLVNRSGTMQTSSITLNQEEIKNIMQNISDKTRIPLTSGVFKAAVQDLIVTAVLSDFVGTRFLVQKRSPFLKY